MSHVLLFALCLAAPPPTTTSAAQLGSLQRTAASLDDALDVYRLALLELVPALRQVMALGAQRGATPGTPVPDVALDVFKRLNASVQRRINAGALPAVPRAYHAEVVDALDHLANAPSLSAVPAPAKSMYLALTHLAASADEVVDVFSRQRPMLEVVLNPETALDDITEALDQLAIAEANIKTVQAHKGAPGEQLQAFLRLEIALGHALDLIAAAEEQGIHIGFEMQHSTVGLARRLSSVHTHLHELHELVTAMAKEPHPAGGDLRAEMLEKPDGSATVQLTWTPPNPGRGAPALLRVYRRNNMPGLTQQLVATLRCEGQTADAARAKAASILEPLSADPERLVDLPPGRAAWTDAVARTPAAAPLYRLVAVSAFGIESKSQEHAALSLPHTLSPPLLAVAQAAAPEPESGQFYQDADAVTITWQPSQSDLSGQPAAMSFAEAHALPTLARYDVFRLQGQEAIPVAHVPPGITQWIDRPPLRALKEGVLYAVAAVDGEEHQTRGDKACAQTNVVMLDVSPALAEASAGAQFLGHPTHYEAEKTLALANAQALAQARETFQKRPEAERNQLLARWWNSADTLQKIAWLAGWPNAMTDNERDALLRDAPLNLRARDLPQAQAAVWFAENPIMQVEIERYWRLLDDPAHKAALQSWREHQNRAHAAWLQARLRNADGKQKDELEQPAHVQAWWNARDVEEQDRLQRWWKDMPPQVRAARLTTWFNAQPGAVQLSMAWPDWEQLTQSEREPLLRDAYKSLPTGLWPTFLAWVSWTDLDPTTKAQLITDQVGPWDSLTAHLRYALRPIDAWLDFKLTLALLVIALGALSGFLLQYASRHTLSDPPDL